MQMTLCLQCGDGGFTDSFVYCVKCLKFAVHRYCLDKIPQTFDEFVDWSCDDCELELPGTALQIINYEERTNAYLTDLRNQRTVGDSGSLTKPALACGNKKRKRPLVAKKEKVRLEIAQIDEADEDAEFSGSLSIELKEKQSFAFRAENADNEIQCAEARAELELTKTSDKDSFPENSEEKLKSSGPDTPREICSPENALALTDVEQGRPFECPIWSGSFYIMNKDRHVFDGMAAHLSTTACSKAVEETALFPFLLSLEMYPKADIWPKNFTTKSQPSNNIALYFLAHKQRHEKLFDQLVSDMMNGKLALKSNLQNAELLIFTSLEMSCGFQKFQGKFYLWGVFRAKKAWSFW